MKTAEEQKREIIDGCTEEWAHNYGVVFSVPLAAHEAMCLIGSLQLALRHPQNTGLASEVVRALIERIKDAYPKEFVNTRKLIDAGFDQHFDE